MENRDARGEARKPRTHLRHAAYVAMLCAVLASYLWRVSGLDLRFPTPWPDEGSFLWPAIAIQETNRLFAPQLHPERDVLWMPPGYMVVQGLVFKLTGFSLAWARSLSALYLCVALGALAALLAGFRARFGHLLLLGVFLHAPIALLAGNTARMEPLLLAVVCGAMLCIHRNQPWPGLALLAVAPLVHPNGLFFALGGAGYFVWRTRGHPELRRLSPGRLAWLVLPFLLWAAYGAYAVHHRDSLLGDMAFQVGFKQMLDEFSGGYRSRLQQWELWGTVLGTLLAGSYAARRRLPLFAVFAIAVSAQVLTVLTRGWMYEVHLALAQLLVAVACVESAFDVASRRARRGVRLPALAAAAAALSLAVALNVVLTRAPFALKSVKASTVYPERIAGVAYFDESDRRTVRAYLDALPRSGRELTVQFLPWADALLFHDLDGAGLRLEQPTFHERGSHVYILHESRWISDASRRTSLFIASRERIPRDRFEEIHSRDGTERWLVFRREAAAATTPGAGAPE